MSDERPVHITPLKVNPRGKFVGSRQKLMIVNLYKSKIVQQPTLKVKEVVKIISKELGIGQNNIQLTISEYKNNKTVSSPNKSKIRATFKDKIDDFERDAIRRKVHEFWFRKQLPTLDKILRAVNEDPDLNTYKRSVLNLLIRDLNCVHVKRGRNSALIERDDIVLWRTKYIEDIRKYREQRRTIYYLDETWVNAGDCNDRIWRDNTVTSHRDAFLSGLSTGAPNPTTRGKRLIVVHIGSNEGFVDGGLLVFESKKDSSDYHQEMNVDVFFDWLKDVIPLLKDNSVIVMDNAPYHSVKLEKCPTLSWKKVEIESWLEEKGEPFQRPINKVRLMDIVKSIKPQFNKLVVDEYVKTKNMTVLRTPPYHCELNPIELAWSSVKRYVKTNNTTFKLPDVKKLLIDGVNQCTPEMWKNCVEHVIKIEDRFWNVDITVDDVMDDDNLHVMTITGDTSDSDDLGCETLE
ncbi:uncharacterized protein LOC132933017 [Metopolophium dirhodum]|uniref:uncharacterized protein LOC132933017 n=1 Tax=Metopolophium dirhodum TaxID=44670 RepID=UPI0029903236|nr:uncharacterized protein LOC132933017 [Metopolophium dirhodum]